MEDVNKWGPNEATGIWQMYPQEKMMIQCSEKANISSSFQYPIHQLVYCLQ